MGAYNRTSRPAPRPAKFYLARPLPAAGVEEDAGVEEGAGVEEEASVEEGASVKELSYIGTLTHIIPLVNFSYFSFNTSQPGYTTVPV